MNGYTVEEAARVLGIPTERVWDLVARGVFSGARGEDGTWRVHLGGTGGQRTDAATPSDGPAGGHPVPDSPASAGELSPFRELLTEFRHLTERYGQALLALGEARGEVASLTTRVDALEARVDLRLPYAGPVPTVDGVAQAAVATAVADDTEAQPVAAVHAAPPPVDVAPSTAEAAAEDGGEEAGEPALSESGEPDEDEHHEVAAEPTEAAVEEPGSAAQEEPAAEVAGEEHEEPDTSVAAAPQMAEAADGVDAPPEAEEVAAVADEVEAVESSDEAAEAADTHEEATEAAGEQGEESAGSAAESAGDAAAQEADGGAGEDAIAAELSEIDLGEAELPSAELPHADLPAEDEDFETIDDLLVFAGDDEATGRADHEPEPAAEAAFTAETEPDTADEAPAEAASSGEPEPETEPDTAAEVEAAAEAEPESAPEPVSEGEPESVAETAVEAEPESVAEQMAEAEPKPVMEAAAEPEPAAEAETAGEAETAADAVPAAELEPASETIAAFDIETGERTQPRRNRLGSEIAAALARADDPSPPELPNGADHVANAPDSEGADAAGRTERPHAATEPPHAATEPPHAATEPPPTTATAFSLVSVHRDEEAEYIAELEIGSAGWHAGTEAQVTRPQAAAAVATDELATDPYPDQNELINALGWEQDEIDAIRSLLSGQASSSPSRPAWPAADPDVRPAPESVDFETREASVTEPAPAATAEPEPASDADEARAPATEAGVGEVAPPADAEPAVAAADTATVPSAAAADTAAAPAAAEAGTATTPSVDAVDRGAASHPQEGAEQPVAAQSAPRPGARGFELPGSADLDAALEALRRRSSEEAAAEDARRGIVRAASRREPEAVDAAAPPEAAVPSDEGVEGHATPRPGFDDAAWSRRSPAANAYRRLRRFLGG